MCQEDEKSSKNGLQALMPIKNSIKGVTTIHNVLIMCVNTQHYNQ